ncbi:hypothetical protein KHM83_16450 [Fusibacter paucivorans]|uniref:Peptidase C39-like domain-containing protein n=1 Tax=Fusibacter paucivorans TaxID=76009 RepID=A0ABS5PT72_9FIRM|nr:hypothetical protein [Fusibacter paucivorans]MBS7528281.1 hypothetical protein [Fusibacter paucivorans]
MFENLFKIKCHYHNFCQVQSNDRYGKTSTEKRILMITKLLLLFVLSVIFININSSSYAATVYPPGNYIAIRQSNIYTMGSYLPIPSSKTLLKDKYVSIKAIKYISSTPYGQTYNDTYIKMNDLKYTSYKDATGFYQPINDAPIRSYPRTYDLTGNKYPIIAYTRYNPLFISKVIYADTGNPFGIIARFHNRSNYVGKYVYMGNLKKYTPYVMGVGYQGFTIKSSCYIISASNLLSNLVGYQITPRQVYSNNGYTVWFNPTKVMPVTEKNKYSISSEAIPSSSSSFEQRLNNLLIKHPEGIFIRIATGTPHFPAGHTLYVNKFESGKIEVIDTHDNGAFTNTKSLVGLKSCASIKEFSSFEEAIKIISLNKGLFRYYE